MVCASVGSYRSTALVELRRLRSFDSEIIMLGSTAEPDARWVSVRKSFIILNVSIYCVSYNWM